MSTTTQYISIHSGVDIDKAVSYYKSLDTYGRTILSVPIEGGIKGDDGEYESLGNWNKVSDPIDGDKSVIFDNNSDYYIKITLIGTYKLGGTPSVCFVDSKGQQWWIDHMFTPLSSGGNFDPTNVQNIYCFSNTPIGGAVIITCNLTDIKTINEDGTESEISASVADI